VLKYKTPLLMFIWLVNDVDNICELFLSYDLMILMWESHIILFYRGNGNDLDTLICCPCLVVSNSFIIWGPRRYDPFLLLSLFYYCHAFHHV
jgi:hypothetical protein